MTERDRRPILVVTAFRDSAEPTTVADTLELFDLLTEEGFDVESTGLSGSRSSEHSAVARVRAPFVGVEQAIETAGWRIDATRIIRHPSAGHGPLRYIIG